MALNNFLTWIDKAARLIIRLLFGFSSDSVVDEKLNQFLNTEAAMLSTTAVRLHVYLVFVKSIEQELKIQ